MKKASLVFAIALAVAGNAAVTKVATQAWVLQRLQSAGIYTSSETVTTNVVNGVTNLVVTSPFVCEEVPECQAIQLEISPPALNMGDGAVDKSLPYIHTTIYEGRFFDGNKWFTFASGWTLEVNIDLPEPIPTGVHVCDIGSSCNCSMAGKSRESVEIPDDLTDLSPAEAAGLFPSPLALIDTDTWGSESWQTTLTVGGQTVYYVKATMDDGATRSFKVESFGQSDVWLFCVAQLRDQWNEYIALLRERYIDEHVCNKDNPQHLWGEWSETVVGWTVTRTRVCQRNNSHVETETEDTSPCRNGHVALANACGCACGYFSPTNNIAGDDKYHHWTAGGTSGRPACMCDCGFRHKFTHMSAYEQGRFDGGYTNCVQCLGICWTCRERDINGNIVLPSQHEAFASAGDQRKAARCGCKCGKVTADGSSEVRFHYRNTYGVGGLPSCLCYGANAKATGAQPGQYHFYSPSSCPKVCSVVHNGRRHLTTTSIFPENSALSYGVTAQPKDHQKKDGNGVCGCECGVYDTSNWSEWNGKADLHRRYQSNDCRCGCPAKVHYPITNACPALCGGSCTGLYSDKYFGEHAGANLDERYHTPSDTDCQCLCHHFSGWSAPAKFHSVSNATEKCFCVCKKYHKFFAPRNDCLDICRLHSNAKPPALLKHPETFASNDDHTFAPDSCFCKCPAHVLRSTGHEFAPDQCDSCYCGQTSRPHKMKTSGAETTSTYTCESCGNTITIHVQPLECERCGFTDSSSWESGHDPGCGTAPHLLVTCPIHNFQFEGPTEEVHDGFGPRYWGTDDAVFGKMTKTSNWAYISLNHELSENLDEWFEIFRMPVYVAGDVVCPKCAEAIHKKEETSGGGSGSGSGGGTGGNGGLLDI